MAQNFLYNNDEVYLEQDWFYLGADSDAGTAVLRQLPPSTALKDVKDGEYLIERRAAWRIRLLDSTNGGSGLSLAQQQMERLLFRAKMQLKQSKKMRAGQTKAYAPDLRGGSGFSSQLRSKIAASTAECDQRHMERQDRRLDRLAAHLTAKAETMNRRSTFEDADGDFAFPSDFCLRDASDPNSARSQGPSGGAQRAVGQAAPSRAEYSPAKPRVPAAAEVTASPERGAHVCALCQSSTIAYNLCSQTESVMHAITSENELATSERLHSQRSELKSGGAGGAVQSTSQSLPVGAAGDITVESSHSSGSYATEAESTSGSLPPALSSRRKSRVRDAAPAVVAPSAPQQQQQLRHLDERERILRLFSLQDAHMLDLIRFKERTAQEALVAEEHARMGLSPAASHFRDRFKHVGLLAHAHRESIVEPHGIGGHFHKLHAELQSSSGGHQLDAHVERLAQELGSPAVELDKRTYPVEFPVGEGIDAYGNPVDRDAPDPVARLHVFPTADELELIAPVDTKAVMELYSQNRAAVAEMLDGFTELCETQMVPNLRRAVERGNRGSLVEILEFTARAAEFVSARRLQVRVAWLLHEIAGSDVGAFDAFRGSFDALLAEVDGTLAFIRFYREKGTSKRKKERA
ncbi:hypothetical protein PybrP1_013007 [[Pythium] brassicae (nom. inval.)]|nr:hypothetical protein PybrP1_013007 [[Pythium] brassicae (nom. inval.)]